MPGVRVVLEDGTFAITDGGGKYSFYGIANRTHVLKVDRDHAAARRAARGRRARATWATRGSRIVDLKSGELHRGDFTIAGCAAPLVDEVKKRRAARRSPRRARGHVREPARDRAHDPDRRCKALPASGVVQAAPQAGLTQTTTAAAAAAPANPHCSRARARDRREHVRRPTPRIEPTAPPRRMEPLEKLAAEARQQARFRDLADGRCWLRADAGAREGHRGQHAQARSERRRSARDARRQARHARRTSSSQAWEYIGVELQGRARTRSRFRRCDPFGNARGSETRARRRPRQAGPDRDRGSRGRRHRRRPHAGARQRRSSPTSDGTPVTVAHAGHARHHARPLAGRRTSNPAEPGLQVFVEGGARRVRARCRRWSRARRRRSRAAQRPAQGRGAPRLPAGAAQPHRAPAWSRASSTCATSTAARSRRRASPTASSRSSRTCRANGTTARRRRRARGLLPQGQDQGRLPAHRGLRFRQGLEGAPLPRHPARRVLPDLRRLVGARLRRAVDEQALRAHRQEALLPALGRLHHPEPVAHAASSPTTAARSPACASTTRTSA